MALDDKPIQDLTKSIRDLIKVFNSSGGLKPSTSPISTDGDGGDSYLTKKEKEARLARENQIKFDRVRDKILNERLKTQKNYDKLTKQILINEEKILEIEAKKNNLQSQQEKYLKKREQYDRLNAINTASMTKTELAAHKKMLKSSEQEFKLASKEYTLSDRKARAEAKQQRLKDKHYKENKAEIDEQTRKAQKQLEKEERVRKRQQGREESVEKIKHDLRERRAGVIRNASASIFSFMKQTLNSAFEQDSIMSKLASNYTLSRSETAGLKQNLLQASISTAFIGVKTEDLVKMQSNYTDELGRSVILDQAGLKAVAEMGIATGVGVEGASQMAAQMEKFGFSAVSATENIQDLMNASKRTGMSASVMTRKVQENMNIANSYTFRNGIKGFESMVMHSTKLRINMSDVASLADKVSSPEGAIQTAASLQVLGGAFAQMADPMQLMNQGITDLQGLTKTYDKMLAGVTSINKETGEISINGYDRLRIKAAAEAMGVSFDNMMEVARTKGKRSAIDTQINLNPVIKGADEETKDMIASLAQFDKKTKQFKITVGGKSKSLMELTPDVISQLQPAEQGTNLRVIAEATMGISDIIKNGFNAIVQSLMPKLIGLIGDFTQWISPKIEKLVDFLGGEKGQKTAVGGGLGLGIGAVVGGALGAFIGGPVGAQVGSVAGGAIGTAIGGLIGSNSANDLIIPSDGGKPIFLNSKDDVFAMKPNGAIAQAVSNNSTTNILNSESGVPTYHGGKESLAEKIFGRRNTVVSPTFNASRIFGGVEPAFSGVYGGNGSKSGSMDLNINGTITLVGGGNSTKISASELIKDRQFLRELTRIIGNQMNRDNNGGKYQGGLNNNSL